MITASARRALVALTTAAALLPAAPALAQTATPTPSATATPSASPTASPTATPTVTTSPTPAPITINVDRTLIDYGQTVQVRVFGQVGGTVQLFGNGRQIRTATVGPFEGGQVGIATFNLQPGDRTLFYALVNGRQSASVTVEVRRTVTIGIEQRTRGIYTFSGVIARAEAGVQVTIARLDSETRRVTGVASTRTDAAGRYVISTSLPQGLAGYYALTGVTNVGALQAGRSRLYGLLVNTRPVVQSDPRERDDVAAQDLSIGARAAGRDVYTLSGRLTPGRTVPITLAEIRNGRRVGIAGGRTGSSGLYSFTVTLRRDVDVTNRTFQVLTGTATSRAYTIAVPALTQAEIEELLENSGEGSIYPFANCAEARAAGEAPLRRGDPGYSRNLDRDNDGVGCE